MTEVYGDANLPCTMMPQQSIDCPDCHMRHGLVLQNVSTTIPTNVPLLYVCQHCGMLFTIPPPPIRFTALAGLNQKTHPRG